MTAAADNSDPRDYVLDLSGVEGGGADGEAETRKVAAAVSFLSIHFKCCHVYSRIYKNAAGTAYAGHCPRCRRAATIAIAPGGSTARIFQAE